MRGVQDVGTQPSNETREPGLLPGHARTPVGQPGGYREEVRPGRLAPEVLHVPLLDGHGEVDPAGSELGDEVVDVAPHASEVSGDCSGVQEDLEVGHGARLLTRSVPLKTRPGPGGTAVHDGLVASPSGSP